MVRVASLGLLFLAAAVPGPRSPLTREAADAFAHKLAGFEGRLREGKPPVAAGQEVLVREVELNSFLNLSLGEQMPPGLADVDIRFERERLAARGTVDLDKIPIKLGSGSTFNPLAYLSGRVPIELVTRLKTDDGFGSFEPEEIRLATLPIPVSVLQRMVAQATRTKDNPQGFDVLSPFRLPYGAKRIKLVPGKATLQF